MQVRILPPLPILESQFRPYSYLLGICLGDGHITHTPRTYRLSVYMNANDTRVIARVVEAMSLVVPRNRVGFRYRPSVIVVNAYSCGWPALFPQHGPGRKHTRPIVLEAWQREIVERHPWDFIAGCIHSDGSRHRRIVNGRDYPAYGFTNRSEDILGLFTWACDRVGVRWRRANFETISIARRPDVARFDATLMLPTPFRPR